MSRVTTVAIVGLGSRGLSVLERIITLARRAGPGTGPIEVEIVDPGDGAGVHTVDQPDYLLLNTTSAQVSMFPDPATVGEAAAVAGPNLYEWVTARGLRLAEDGYTVGGAGRAIRPTDFLPRRILGEYLEWFFGWLRQCAPDQLRLRQHRTEAVELTGTADQRLTVCLADGGRFKADYAFLTTGYTSNLDQRQREAGRSRLISTPYPLPQQLAQVRPGESVAIGGFGLSAMDIMSSLTVGRGGRFVPDLDGCRYLPSGREPQLFFYSRSGLPCRARPLVMEVGPAYRPLVFTAETIDALRADQGRRLDFDRDVLPLVYTEMRVAYRRCEAGLAGPTTAGARERELTEAGGPAEITRLLDEWDARLGRFDPAAAFDPAPAMSRSDSATYQKWLAEVVQADLAEGRLGFEGSPLKAALDTVRALRDNFRRVIDFRGLTDDSLADFHRRIVPMINRAVVGPQYERHSELLALLAGGHAQAPFGPAPTVQWQPPAGRWMISATGLDAPHSQQIDWVCAANVAPPGVADSASPLISSLYRAGWLRPHLPGSELVPGVDVDRDQHPLRADGTPERRVWVLGPLCEGATYYNNLVPSPGGFSRPIFDAHRCVAELLGGGPVVAPRGGEL